MPVGGKHMKSWRTSFTKNRHNRTAVLLLLLFLTFISAVLNMCCGAVFVSLEDIIAVVLKQPVSGYASSIILFSRLPRTCGCFLAGAALAVSGTVIQSVLNNPLAAPNTIGVNTGAGLAVALCGAFFPTAAILFPLAAFCGALLGVLLALFIAERTGASKITLVLSGVVVSNIFSAGIDTVLTFFPDALIGYSDFRIGGLANLTMARILPAAYIIGPLFLLVILLSNELDILILGRDTAQSLGLSVKYVRILFLVLAAALAGAAVSFSGLLGFVGIIVPHTMRYLIGEDSCPLLISSALGGASFLMLCDLLAKILFAPYELPVGIVLSFVGGPFFIWLLLHQRGGRTYD